jgi:hypothetical protein
LQKEQEDSKKLKELRDLAVFAFFMVNALFVLVILMLQSREELHIQWPFGDNENTVGSSGEVNIMYTNIYIYIYVEGERETGRQTDRESKGRYDKKLLHRNNL